MHIIVTPHSGNDPRSLCGASITDNAISVGIANGVGDKRALIAFGCCRQCVTRFRVLPDIALTSTQFYARKGAWPDEVEKRQKRTKPRDLQRKTHARGLP